MEFQKESEWILSSKHPSAMGAKLSPNEKVWEGTISMQFYSVENDTKSVKTKFSVVSVENRQWASSTMQSRVIPVGFSFAELFLLRIGWSFLTSMNFCFNYYS